MPIEDGIAEITEERTERISPVPRARGRVATVRSLLGFPLVVGVVIVGILAGGFFGGEPAESPVALASSTPVATPVPTVAATVPVSVTPTASAAPDSGLGDLACGEGRLRMTAGGGRGQFGVLAPSNPLGTKVAMALEATATSGQVVVAGVADAQVVASFSAAEIRDAGGVRVIDANERELLVLSEYFPTRSRNGGPFCANLFLVARDGSSVTPLTDYGAGSRVRAAGFAPDGRVFYVEGRALHLRDGREEATVDHFGCGTEVSHLAWSPDGRRVAMFCDGLDLVLVDTATNDSSIWRVTEVGQTPLALAWKDRRSMVLAVAAPEPGFAVEAIQMVDIEVDRGALRFQRRLTTDLHSAWVLGRPTFSPDLRWLLVQGEADSDREFYPTFRIDMESGAARAYTFPVLSNEFPESPTTWLPGPGYRVIVDELGTLYEVDLDGGTRETVGAVPAGDFVVLLPVGKTEQISD